MSIFTLSLIVVCTAFVFGYFILKFISFLFNRFLDRALDNERDYLPQKYELPRYFKLNKKGEVDTSVRWPGWDGWYFFLLPEDKNIPIKMIRASLMTGLYGLDGIDNYKMLLPLHLSTFKAVEYLTLIPTEEIVDRKTEKENHLSHHYLPKAADLMMNDRKLDVAVKAAKANSDEDTELYGKINGTWPNYTFEFINPEAEIEVNLNYKGDKILWWADFPNIFTYFAAFGKFDGKIIYKRGISKDETDKEDVYSVKGEGCFEHGFARKPFNFDVFWLPIRLLKNIIPCLKPIRYHYELFIGEEGMQGGFMHARGFGTDFRNLGGFYLKGTYIRINSVRIKYFDVPEPDLVDTPGPGSAVKFYRRWQVKAVTDDGILEYIGTREWPPAPIAGNMTFYNFSYEGTYREKKISGNGYGEYLHI